MPGGFSRVGIPPCLDLGLEGSRLAWPVTIMGDMGNRVSEMQEPRNQHWALNALFATGLLASSARRRSIRRR